MIGFNQTKIGDISLISRQKAFLLILIFAFLGMLISYGLYHFLSISAASLVQSGSTGGDALDQINSAVASGSPLLISSISLILPLLASLLVLTRYSQGQVVSDTKLKNFHIMTLPKNRENATLQAPFFRILADYCRSIKVIDHPSNEKLHLMSQANVEKYYAARSRFLNLIENDSEIANISTVDFANLNLSPSQKMKIDSALLDS